MWILLLSAIHFASQNLQAFSFLFSITREAGYIHLVFYCRGFVASSLTIHSLGWIFNSNFYSFWSNSDRARFSILFFERWKFEQLDFWNVTSVSFLRLRRISRIFSFWHFSMLYVYCFPIIGCSPNGLTSRFSYQSLSTRSNLEPWVYFLIVIRFISIFTLDRLTPCFYFFLIRNPYNYIL